MEYLELVPCNLNMKAFKFTKRNIRRTPYQALAASMVMFLTFLTLIMFLILAAGTQKAIEYTESRPQAIAFFKDGTTPTDIQAIQDALWKTGKVKDIKYVSKEDALEIYKDKNKSEPILTELVSASMLPESIEISTYSPEDLELIAQMLIQEPVIGDPNNVVLPKDVIQVLTQTTSVIRAIGAVVVGFLLTFALLIIVMIISFKIRIKRGEIEIMKLLGASDWFIRTPFIFEGIFYGLFGAVSAWIFSYAVIWYFTPMLQPLISDLKFLPISPVLMLGLLGIAILIAIIIGALGSFSAVRRHLRV